MVQSSGLLKRTLNGAQTMDSTAAVPDEAWRYRNLVEVVRLAAIQLHAESESFTWKALVRMSRKFHRNKSLPDSMIANVMKEACVEVDMASGMLRLASTETNCS
jgi:hypothetical protein